MAEYYTGKKSCDQIYKDKKAGRREGSAVESTDYSLKGP